MSEETLVYQSPLTDKMLIAIGRLITCWAGVEITLPLQVARLVASHPNPRTKTFDFDHITFVKAAFVSGGSAPRAALTQMVNLLGPNTDAAKRVKSIGDDLLDKKDRRDYCAHMIVMPDGDEAISLQQFAAAKAKPMTIRRYTVAQVEMWANDVRQGSLELDRTISEVTGWTWTRIQQSMPQSIPNLPAPGD